MTAIGLALALVTTPPARAAPPAAGLQLETRAGAAWLLHSRSKAIGHVVKPSAALTLLWPLSHRLELGGGAIALLDGNSHYRVLGVLAVVRYALLTHSDFTLAARAGLGAGNDADILHGDLRANGSLLPYGFISAAGTYAVHPRHGIGIELSFTNLGMIEAGVIWRLGL